MGGARSGCHLLRARLDRPHGASPHISRASLLPSCKRGLLVAMLCHRNLFSNSQWALMDSVNLPLSWPPGDQFGPVFVRVRKQADSGARRLRIGVNPCAPVVR